MAALRIEILEDALSTADQEAENVSTMRSEAEKKFMAIHDTHSFPQLPRDIIIHILSMTPHYTIIKRIDEQHCAEHSFGRVYRWLPHMVNPSLRLRSSVSTSFCKASLCRTMELENVDLYVHVCKDVLTNEGLPILLAHPHRWKALDIETSSTASPIGSIIECCSSVLPYVERLTIRSISDLFPHIIPVGSAHLDVVAMNNKGIRLKDACIPWALLAILTELGLLGSVTRLKLTSTHNLITFSSPSISILQRISKMNNLSELELDDIDYTTLCSHNTEPIDLPSLHSIILKRIDDYRLIKYLGLFQNCELESISLGKTHRYSFDGENLASSIHGFFPRLQKLYILDIVSTVSIFINSI